ncbi:P-loop containing nucleoside triphosphate hydrolase protein [Cytidiella melzeri]|nr:P-loop containing nucleoside triphosphate hydrolase protein [Cytidiella melzeri]
MSLQAPVNSGNPRARAGGGEIIIAVMGPTGVGKSSFINAASGSRLVVGETLKSCTSVIRLSEISMHSSRRVVFIDTPGFDDTTMSDVEVLKKLALFLSTIYDHGYQLSGIIYMHRISDRKVGGTSRKNLNMFRKLCGEDALRNVAFVTTMWDQEDPERAAARERELASRDEFFKPMLSQGATMYRHYNSVASAQGILSKLVSGLSNPVTLQIQRELAEKDVNIADTAAGKELMREQKALVKKQVMELEQVQHELKEARESQDAQTSGELDEVRRYLAAKIGEVERECKELACEYATKKIELQARIEEAMRALELGKEERKAADQKLEDMRNSLEGWGDFAGSGRRDGGKNRSKKIMLSLGFSALARLVDVALNVYELCAQT